MAVGLREVENNTVTIRKLGSNNTSTVNLNSVIDNLTNECKIPD